MIKGSVPYMLCRIEDDSSLTPVSEHEDIVSAVVAGKHQVEVGLRLQLWRLYQWRQGDLLR
jgi:hypothetical protein